MKYFVPLVPAVVFFLFLSVSLNAQTDISQNRSTAEEIEILLNTDAVSYAQASRFVLEAANVLTVNNPEEAFDYAFKQGWLPNKTTSGDSARLDNISKLLLESFKVKGGIMYSITGSPHYAYRELVYINVIQNRHDPSMLVSGERLLFYVSRILGRTDMHVSEEKQASERSVALAAEIAVIIEEQAIADTTVEATEEGVTITLSNIVFAADSAELPNAERLKIMELARILKSISGIKLLIAGHTTQAGSVEFQLELSKARAQSVANYLVSLDACEEKNISIIGYGGSRPIADNSTPQGMAANRRVEITILEN